MSGARLVPLVLALLFLPHAHAFTASLGLRAEGPLAQPPGESADRVEERYGPFIFRCPDTFMPQSARPNPPDTRVFYGCPMLVEDQSDFFGNIELAVNPSDHNEFVFFSLHGQPADDGATERSRTGLTHTAFTTRTGGSGWTDNPIQGPRDAFGEEAGGVFDTSGNIYLGYLWSVPTAGRFASELRLYKSGGISDRQAFDDTYEDPWGFDDRGMDVYVRRFGMTSVLPAHLERRAGPEAANESGPQAPADEADMGRAALEGNLTNELVVATWHAEALDWRNATTGMARWIDAAWTGTATENEWTALRQDELIGPCMNASAPVAYRGKVYVACSVDRGYDATPRARIGDIHIWSIDPSDGTTRFVAATGIRGQNPLLRIGPDGYSVVVAYDAKPPHDVSVQTAYGWDGRSWGVGRLTGSGDIGGMLHRLAGYRPLLDAHVTNFVVTEKDKTIFLFYGEWDEPREADAQAIDPGSTADPGRDLPKVLLAFNECDPQVGALVMNRTAHTLRVDVLSTPGTSTARGTYPPGAFNDAHDGLVYVRDPVTDEELVYFTINDHGVAQFGAIVVGATAGFCSPVPPPVLPPAVPVPQAVSAVTSSHLVAGAGVGALSSLMIGYLLTVKRRTAHYVTAEDR